MEGRLQREPISFTLRSPCHRGTIPSCCHCWGTRCGRGQGKGLIMCVLSPPPSCHCSMKAPSSVAVHILTELTVTETILQKATKYQTPLLVSSELIQLRPPSRQPNS